ncbi:hypothetical protein [Bradyrhizobium ottawaense]|uniref:hypothetical protein n=1 Tax=Bradyrhizobium ottawaense TaxID=931866 RepID=UPI002012EB7B|nr:hypothetical protein [Bradyrhizobium ottawaense]
MNRAFIRQLGLRSRTLGEFNDCKEARILLHGYHLCWTGLSQVELKTYADRDGYLDVRKLSCAQPANTFQEDADYLAAWYSGWYNGLAKKHVMQVARAKSLQHGVIVHCKANPGKKVIEAIDTVFKDYRTEQGITTKR